MWIHRVRSFFCSAFLAARRWARLGMDASSCTKERNAHLVALLPGAVGKPVVGVGGKRFLLFLFCFFCLVCFVLFLLFGLFCLVVCLFVFSVFFYIVGLGLGWLLGLCGYWLVGWFVWLVLQESHDTMLPTALIRLGHPAVTVAPLNAPENEESLPWRPAQVACVQPHVLGRCVFAFFSLNMCYVVCEISRVYLMVIDHLCFLVCCYVSFDLPEVVSRL